MVAASTGPFVAGGNKTGSLTSADRVLLSEISVFAGWVTASQPLFKISPRNGITRRAVWAMVGLRFFMFSGYWATRSPYVSDGPDFSQDNTGFRDIQCVKAEKRFFS